MSDYLSHLVDRIHNPAPALQPRLASLFEPVAPSLPSTMGRFSGDAPLRAPDPDQAPLGVAPAPAKREPELASPAPVMRHASENPIEQRSSTRAPRHVHPAAEEGADLVQLPHGPLAEQPIAQPRPGMASTPSLDTGRGEVSLQPPAPAHERNAGPPAAAERPAGQDADLSRRDRPAKVAAAAIEESSAIAVRTTTPHRGLLTPVMEPAMAEHPALPTFASPQPTGVPERSATGRSAQAVTSLEQHGVAPDTRLATPPTARPAPEGLATIRVTIGRVEVRAVTPPAPMTTQGAKGSPGPALSLDGYLKQRDEARR